jgi:hypothetical protein
MRDSRHFTQNRTREASLDARQDPPFRLLLPDHAEIILELAGGRAYKEKKLDDAVKSRSARHVRTGGHPQTYGIHGFPPA